MLKLLKKIRHVFPSSLPSGASEFEAFVGDICETHSLPVTPSYKHAIATMIMHLGPTVDKKPKLFFARSIRKAEANQVAYAMIEKIREEEKASKKLLEEQEKTRSEATQPPPQSELVVEKAKDTQESSEQQQQQSI